MLELVGVVLMAGGVTRLDRCSFAARSGEVLGLVGGTGSGKTAALEVAAGLARPERGRVLLEGRDVTRNVGRLRGAVALAPDLAPGPSDLSVEAWLELWSALDGSAPESVRDAAERLGAPGPARTVGTLSIGELRRLSLTRAFARRVPLYLLDGPAQGLDGDGLRRLTQAIRSAAADGATVILSASAPFLPSSVCDRVVCLGAGRSTGEVLRGEPTFEGAIARAQGWAV